MEDDYAHPYCEVQLAAHGAYTRRKMAAEMKFWMSAKAGAGTVLDYIGGRNVLSGGFGTLTPTKRLRTPSSDIGPDTFYKYNLTPRAKWTTPRPRARAGADNAQLCLRGS